MNPLEKFERVGKAGTIGIFLCSSALSAIIIFVIVLSFQSSWKGFRHIAALMNRLQFFSVALAVVMIVLTVWRYFQRKALAARHPSLRPALRDEAFRADWLKAFRPTFFLLLLLQLAAKTPLTFWHAPWDMPLISPLTISLAIMSLTGFFLYYNRRGRHE